MLLPALAAAKRKAQKINCTNNLKQVGIALRIWEGDNGDKYPMAVQTSSGGAEEEVARAGAPATGGENPGYVFLVMSNELATPKILYCPSDTLHNQGVNFTITNTLGGTANAAPATKPTGISTISYFINGDAVEADPQAVVSGDCNIGTASALSSSSSAQWRFTQSSATQTSGGSDTAVELSSDNFSGTGTTYWAWTANDLHQKTGNLLIADGSVQSETQSGLHTALMNSTNITQNPYFNFIY